MFTGIIEEMGSLKDREGDHFTFNARTVLDEARIGDSTAVNGCCLTITDFGEDWWTAGLSDETLSRTSLDALKPGDPVNLERPVRLQDRLGGHLVQGHVDAVGTVIDPAPNLRISMPEKLMRYMVEKGSITVDGVSLTVVDVFEDGFSVALIEHTMAVTNLGSIQPGAKVNLEVDVMAKYAERLLPFVANL